MRNRPYSSNLTSLEGETICKYINANILFIGDYPICLKNTGREMHVKILNTKISDPFTNFAN
jgi:hypothetical protein